MDAVEWERKWSTIKRKIQIGWSKIRLPVDVHKYSLLWFICDVHYMFCRMEKKYAASVNSDIIILILAHFMWLFKMNFCS